MLHRAFLPASLMLAFVSLSVAQQKTGPDFFTVSGANLTALSLKAADLASMPREKVKVSEADGSQVEYEGVLLKEVLQRAGAPVGKLRGKSLSSYIVAKAADGYQVVFTLPEIDAEFVNEPILIADKRDGKPLAGSMGPFRLTIPNDKVGARSIRMLSSIELVRIQ